jgi:hypothetical protein
MSTYYELDMAAQGKEITVRYLIRENELTRIWKTLIRNILQSKYYTLNPEYQWSNVSYDENVCATVIDRMKKTAIECNKMSDDFEQIIIPDIDASELPFFSPEKIQELKDCLNRLHETFHEYGEKHRRNFSPLNQLNNDIHALETQVSSLGIGENTARRTTSSFFVSGNSPKEYPLDSNDSLYDFFHLEEGDTETGLFLGYHTVGKDIRTCVMDNDVELVKHNMVRPQITIHTECLCEFHENSSNLDSKEVILKEIEDWVHKNNLEEYIDMSLSCNRITGRPKLGDLITDIEFDKIYDMMCSEDFKIVDCRLIEG